MNKPRIAVIGAGHWGSNLIRVFTHLGVLEYVCDEKYIIVNEPKRHYSDYRELIKKEDIDAVVIATPPDTHAKIATYALQHGKHVFVEKPFVLDMNEGQYICQLARKKGKTLMVGHVMQYHPTFRMLKQIIRDGELGELRYIYSNRLNIGKVRQNENALWSFAPHDISMILKLAEAEPINVTATGGNYLHEDIADVTTTHLEFKSGLKAHTFVSWLHPYKEQKLVVIGSEKMAVFDDTVESSQKLRLYRHSIASNGDITKGEPEYAVAVKTEPLINECKHFLDCIRTGQRPLTDGEEAMRVLNVLKQAQKSLDTKEEK